MVVVVTLRSHQFPFRPCPPNDSMSTFVFDQAIAVVPLGERDGKTFYEGQLHSSFRVGSNPHGGYLMAMVANAGVTYLKEKNPNTTDPIHITAHFYGVAKLGKVEIAIEPAKMGKRMVNLRGKILQNGREIVECHVIYGNLQKEQGVSIPQEVSMNHAITIEPLDINRTPDTLNSTVHRYSEVTDWWVDHSLLENYKSKKQALSLGWTRFKDERPMDPLSLIFFADLPLPAIMNLPEDVMPIKGWTPTITMSTQIIKLPTPGAKINSCVLTSKHMHKGRLESDGEVREYSNGKQGEVLAISRQMALFSAATMSANAVSKL